MDIDPINENTRYKLDLSGPREQHIKTDEQQGQGRKALPNASRNDKASVTYNKNNQSSQSTLPFCYLTYALNLGKTDWTGTRGSKKYQVATKARKKNLNISLLSFDFHSWEENQNAYLFLVGSVVFFPRISLVKGHRFHYTHMDKC